MQEALVRGDPEVWDSVIAAAHPEAILVLIQFRMGLELHPLGPEDIWQETLLRAWQGRTNFVWQGIIPFRKWLIRIAENCIADQRDRAHAKKRAGPSSASRASAQGEDPSAAARFEPWGSTTPSRVAAAKERARAMARALESLPEEVRDVVRLRLFEDEPIEAIGRRLGLGESAVRHRFRRGAELYRERLVQLIEESTS